jgi:putative flippase GtrA
VTLIPRVLELRRYTASFLAYALVGGICAVVEWTVFLALLWITEVHYVRAAIGGFAIATLVNYVLSRRYVFLRKTTATYREIVRIYVVSALGFAVNLGVTVLLVDLFGTLPIVGKIVGTGCGFLWNFLGRQFWVFDSTPRHELRVTSRQHR